MKKYLLTATILFSTCIVIAQGRVGINTTNPLAMLHVKDSSVLFTGPLSGPFPAGPPPVSGAGKRLMWYVDKFAFRVGTLDASKSTFWDKDSIGFGSFASGLNTKALGNYSFAAGSYSSASGNNSVAMGSSADARGSESISLGSDSRSSGLASTSVGYSCFAEGDFSTAIGNVTKTFAVGSTVLGFGNDPIMSTNSSSAPSDPILIIGNGGLLTKSNAFVISRDARAFIDPQNKNTGTLDDNALLFGGYNNTGEGISSKRTSGGNQWGLDFYTNSLNRFSITNSGTVQVANNLTVQNGRGIVRSSDATQQKVVKTTFTLNNVALAANATTNFSISWSETFGATPMAYVGNIVSGTSGIAETMLVLSNVTATGATVWVHNTNNSSLTANFTVNLIAIGAQ